MMDARLQVEDLHCSYQGADGQPVEVIAGVNFELKPREFVSIIGPSGCGKSTLFNAVAGLLRPSSGSIRMDGRDISGRCGHVAYMMQRDFLLPWRTILENVLLGPDLAGQPREQNRARALALLQRFGLKGYENAYPNVLSGGMKQRAALLRTIMCDRSIILLDEPFGALDALTRGQMHEWLLGIQREFEQTMILITHDPDEAVYLSDRIYVSGPRPMRFVGVVDINLPQNRTHEITLTPEFASYKREILSMLKERPPAARPDRPETSQVVA
jgi:ABC-type nitrate/sulfonate/bicarbonate transport system ATPase subunit